MLNHETDEELLRHYQAGNKDAFSVFFDRHNRLLFCYMMKKLKNHEESSDAIQEVFLRIHRFIHSYKATEKAMPWIFTIARNVVYDHFADRVRRKENSTEVTKITEFLYTPKVEETVNEQIEIILRELGAADRKLLVERYLDDESFADLATKYGSNPATIRQRLSRLLRKVRAASVGQLR